MKKNSKIAILALGSIAATTITSSAHIVSLGWRDLGGGTVDFVAQHWHGNATPAGGLIFDGVEYAFTSHTWDTNSQTGLSGALVNSSYATYDAATGTLTTLSNPNWLNVTITGIGTGAHTLDSTDIALTEWTLDGGIETFALTLSGGTVTQIANSMSTASTSISLSQTRDVKARMIALRSGLHQRPAAPTISSGKEGSAKDTIYAPQTCPWEAWGQIHYSDHSSDVRRTNNGTAAPVILQPETETQTLGGTIGIDYDLDQNWTVGLALGISQSDIDMKLVGSVDVDSYAIMPYVSYTTTWRDYQIYTDLLYAYGNSDYDTTRAGGITGDTSGDSHGVELNTGLNMQHNDYTHGPTLQVRWFEGEIDEYTEKGLGALTIPEADYKSFATQLGYQFSRQIPANNGVYVPQVRAAWEHEFEADQGNLLGSDIDVLDKDLAVLGVGCLYYSACGWNSAINYEARFGNNTKSHYVGLKVGREF